MVSKLFSYFAFPLSLVLLSCSDPNMKKQGDEYVVNTTELSADVRGFNAPTPLLVHIKDGAVTMIEALPNKETESFFEKVQSQMFPLFVGKDINGVSDVDCVTGATYSSKSVKENVRIAIDYYNQHK